LEQYQINSVDQSAEFIASRTRATTLVVDIFPPVAADKVAASYMNSPVAAPAPVQRVTVTGSTLRRGEADFTPPVFESQSTFSTQFDMPARVNLMSDGREVTLTLATQRFPVKQFLRITPRLF